MGNDAPPQVLVDAECTHDGSLKHMLKFHSWGWDTFERRFLDPDRINNLVALQKVPYRQYSCGQEILMNFLQFLTLGVFFHGISSGSSATRIQTIEAWRDSRIQVSYA